MVEICIGAIATTIAAYVTHLQSGWVHANSIPNYLRIFEKNGGTKVFDYNFVNSARNYSRDRRLLLTGSVEKILFIYYFRFFKIFKII